jgi:hypothetical protein
VVAERIEDLTPLLARLADGEAGMLAADLDASARASRHVPAKKRKTA